MEGRKVLVLNRKVRVSLTKKARLEQRDLKKVGGGGRGRRRVPVRKDSQHQGPVVRLCLLQAQQGGRSGYGGGNKEVDREETRRPAP